MPHSIDKNATTCNDVHARASLAHGSTTRTMRERKFDYPQRSRECRVRPGRKISIDPDRSWSMTMIARRARGICASDSRSERYPRLETRATKRHLDERGENVRHMVHGPRWKPTRVRAHPSLLTNTYVFTRCVDGYGYVNASASAIRSRYLRSLLLIFLRFGTRESRADFRIRLN